MNEQLTLMAIVLGIIHSGIRLATPYLFASLGETFDQKSGVLNLGVEGIMLMGAFSGVINTVTRVSLVRATPLSLAPSNSFDIYIPVPRSNVPLYCNWIGTVSVLTFFTGSWPAHCASRSQDHKAAISKLMCNKIVRLVEFMVDGNFLFVV